MNKNNIDAVKMMYKIRNRLGNLYKNSQIEEKDLHKSERNII
jgi:hypothetical protein